VRACPSAVKPVIFQSDMTETASSQAIRTARERFNKAIAQQDGAKYRVFYIRHPPAHLILSLDQIEQ
jgi:hypothetical protein